MKLSTYAYKEGYYYHPRVDRELLAQYSKGIIASSGCVGSEVPQQVLNKDYERRCFMHAAGDRIRTYLRQTEFLFRNPGPLHRQARKRPEATDERCCTLASALQKRKVNEVASSTDVVERGSRRQADLHQRQPLRRTAATRAPTTRCSASGTGKLLKRSAALANSPATMVLHLKEQRRDDAPLPVPDSRQALSIRTRWRSPNAAT